MEDNPTTRMILFAVGLGICFLTALFAYKSWKAAQSHAQNQVDKAFDVMSEIENDEYNRYQDASVSGSEVLNLIKRYDGKDIGIIVTISTGNTTTSTCYCKGLSCTNGVASYNDATTLGSITDAKDVTKTSKYINPTKTFLGEVLMDSAENIVGLHFTLNN